MRTPLLLAAAWLSSRLCVVPFEVSGTAVASAAIPVRPYS